MCRALSTSAISATLGLLMVCVYLEDILVTSKTQQEHIANLK